MCATWPAQVILGSLPHLTNIVCQFPPLFQGNCVLTHTRIISKPSRQEVTQDNIKQYPCTTISGIKRYNIIPYVMFYVLHVALLIYVLLNGFNAEPADYDLQFPFCLAPNEGLCKSQHNATSDTQLPDFQKPQ
jgi:hypothetical protein